MIEANPVSRVSWFPRTIGRSYVRHAPWPLPTSTAAHYLNPYLRDHPHDGVTTTRFGSHFAFNSRDLIQRYIWLFGVWEPHMSAWLQRSLRSGDTFIDVGANIGYYSMLASSLVGPTGRVVAVEVSPVFYRQVQRNSQLNGYTNVHAINSGVSDRTETLTFTLATTSNLGATSIVPPDGRPETEFTAATAPLPAVIDAGDLARARVIKIDVEGAEGRVIRSLAPVLDQLRADAELVVEITPARLTHLGDSVDELLNTMRDSGFHTYLLPTEYRPESYPAALRKPRLPVRWEGEMDGETELVFSRTDAAQLG